MKKVTESPEVNKPGPRAASRTTLARSSRNPLLPADLEFLGAIRRVLDLRVDSGPGSLWEAQEAQNALKTTSGKPRKPRKPRWSQVY